MKMGKNEQHDFNNYHDRKVSCDFSNRGTFGRAERMMKEHTIYLVCFYCITFLMSLEAVSVIEVNILDFIPIRGYNNEE